MKIDKEFCPVRDIISHLGDKWSILVVLMLGRAASMRFSQLQREIPDISQKMLTQTLRKLEDMSLIVRTIYPEVPPRVEYNLSPLGRSFVDTMAPMISWAKENKELILKNK